MLNDEHMDEAVGGDGGGDAAQGGGGGIDGHVGAGGAAAGAAAPQELPKPVLRLLRVAERLGRELLPPEHLTAEQLLELADGTVGCAAVDAATAALASPGWGQAAAAGLWGVLLLVLFADAPRGGAGAARLLRRLWAVSARSSRLRATVNPSSEEPDAVPAPAPASGWDGLPGARLDRCALREFVCAVLVLLRHEEVVGSEPPQPAGEPYKVLHNSLLEVREGAH